MKPRRFRSGEFIVEAIYDAYLGEGVIRLLKHDRTTVELSMTRLSEEDRLFAVEASRQVRIRSTYAFMHDLAEQEKTTAHS